MLPKSPELQAIPRRHVAELRGRDDWVDRLPLRLHAVEGVEIQLSFVCGHFASPRFGAGG